MWRLRPERACAHQFCTRPMVCLFFAPIFKASSICGALANYELCALVGMGVTVCPGGPEVMNGPVTRERETLTKMHKPLGKLG